MSSLPRFVLGFVVVLMALPIRAAQWVLQSYEGEARPAQAVVRVYPERGVIVKAIDGRRIASEMGLFDVIELLPGPHTLIVAYGISGFRAEGLALMHVEQTAPEQPLAVDSKGGESYDVHANVNGDAWNPKLAPHAASAPVRETRKGICWREDLVGTVVDTWKGRWKGEFSLRADGETEPRHLVTTIDSKYTGKRSVRFDKLLGAGNRARVAVSTCDPKIAMEFGPE